MKELSENILWRDYADREIQIAELIEELDSTDDPEMQEEILEEFLESYGSLTSDEEERISAVLVDVEIF